MNHQHSHYQLIFSLPLTFPLTPFIFPITANFQSPWRRHSSSMNFRNSLSIRFSDLIKSGTVSLWVLHKKHGKQKWLKSSAETSYQHNAIIPKTKQNCLSVLSSRTFLLFASNHLKFEWSKQKSLPSFIRFFSQRQIVKYNFINETIPFRKFRISHSFSSVSIESYKPIDLFTKQKG